MADEFHDGIDWETMITRKEEKNEKELAQAKEQEEGMKSNIDRLERQLRRSEENERRLDSDVFKLRRSVDENFRKIKNENKYISSLEQAIRERNEIWEVCEEKCKLESWVEGKDRAFANENRGN